MYLISVSKTFANSASRVSSRTKPKNRKMVFYFSESWDFHSKTIGTLAFYYYKYLKIKWKKRKFYCDECENFFTTLVKNSKDKIECPECLLSSNS